MTVSIPATLLPLLILGASPVVVMLVIAFYRSHALICALTAISLAACWASLLCTSPSALVAGAFLVIDDFARFYITLLLGASLVTALLAFNYLRIWQCVREEFYPLLLTATLGCSVLICANHFAAFFLGLEILSVSLYALIAYPRATLDQVEAAVKYLILAATSSAFLLFGMALLYFHFGTMAISTIISRSLADASLGIPLVSVGWGMLLVGIGFKLAIVPFHLWTPDVYQGAPAPVTGLSQQPPKALSLRFCCGWFHRWISTVPGSMSSFPVSRSPPCSSAICWHYCRTMSNVSWPIRRSLISVTS
jgi:NADH-quinone oxidoreductase subunit N